jgi:maltooligosyltrehalose trehalohydrolase
MTTTRRLPLGAELLPGEGAHFRVWAPARRACEVVIEGGARAALEREPGGHFSGAVGAAREGTRYRFRLDGGDLLVPDPASRFQPEGPHGPSQIVDPSRFEWSDAGWRGLSRAGQVLYELHVGTFTPEGTYAAAARELPALAELGITAVELLPLADFPGRFGWGYDGVNLYAPCRLYGGPDDLRRFVDRAHALGLGVVLDVVYNHLGPDGNYLSQFSPSYFAPRKSDWGDALNFDGEGSAGVRELFAWNAAYWVDEYHIDGLRLDAIHAIHDESPEHLVGEVVRRARAAGRGRGVIVHVENDDQDARFLLPPIDADGAWNDDFHHAARVAATGRREGYYRDFHGTAQELVSAASRGYLFQGQRHAGQGRRRGTAADAVAPEQLVTFLQNHDQVAHSLRGLRLHQLTSPGRHRALTALWLLAPGTPLFFQGQEFSASAPFLFFADHHPELAAQVRAGRAEFLAQFPTIASAPARALLDDPASPATFERCKLDLGERARNAGVVALHRDLLRLRREDPTIHEGRGVRGAVLGPEAFCLRWTEGEPRLLLVNLGADLELAYAPEPLLAPPAGGGRWRMVWSSEDVTYGGNGTPAPEDEEGAWRLLGHAAVLLG